MASAVLTAEEVKNRILDGGLADLIELKAERKGNSVYIPELKISITPNVHEVRENFVNIVFVLWSDEWETEMIEGSVGAGKDTESALGMALGMFAYSFMNGLKKAGITLNRKMLSEIAIADPVAFTRLVEQAKKAL